MIGVVTAHRAASTLIRRVPRRLGPRSVSIKRWYGINERIRIVMNQRALRGLVPSYAIIGLHAMHLDRGSGGCPGLAWLLSVHRSILEAIACGRGTAGNGAMGASVVVVRAAAGRVLLSRNLGDELGHGEFNFEFNNIGEGVELHISEDEESEHNLNERGRRYSRSTTRPRLGMVTYTKVLSKLIMAMMRMSMARENPTMNMLNLTRLVYF
jgi:hypothetical protein